MAVWPQKYGCLYIDITWKRLLSAYYNLVSNLDRKHLHSQVQDLFGGPMKCLVCTSVRSGLDLFLSTVDFPKGSEIIFTAINIPDMVSIVESHGLKVVPVDIDLETLAPKEELLELAITDKTVAILVAHIYGKWIEMDKIVDIAHSNGLLVLEDCAECFQGLKPKDNENSDLVFYSFGLIKYSTCLGGAVVKVNDGDLLGKMRTKLESYPVQTSWLFFSKLLKYSMLTCLMNSSLLAWTCIPIFHMFQFDYKEFFISLLRGYPGQIIPQLHFQPSAALLKVMFDILSNVNERSFEVAKMKGDFVGDNMPENVFIPGKKTRISNYWLFPIIVDDPNEVRKALEKEGIEAYQGATQLRTVYKTQCDPQSKQAEKITKLSDDLHHSRQLITSPEVAAGVSQPYAVQTTHSTSGSLLANGVSHTSFSSSAFIEGETKPAIGNQSSVMNLKKVTKDILYPYNAEYLIDHVLYLPVHRNVPLWYLEYVCSAVEKVMKNRSGVQFKNGKKNIVLPSKL
ncbi:uncharacterized protein LOC110246607 [Exaiptasia diaphana]|uniref:Uncharacterized protein n=1 Tax=Exaiptasia diaphana TaxID=2652724 RepID=A0A913XRP3_EXADI|nr:uncharacterized protein LOC110246607 [Exaiptasia diaphana]KXJ09731.1 L-glutamine:2-deoxy-scyllo-inosose aminotransferase [Exaiptasia diaphana]